MRDFNAAELVRPIRTYPPVTLRLVLPLLLACAWLAADTTSGVATTTQQVHIINGGTAACPGAAFCYRPAVLSIASGTKVVWVNSTLVPHTVTRCTKALCGVSGGTGADKGLSSPTLKPGATYSFTFHGKGTYIYFCAVHGYQTMHGGVTVKMIKVT